MDEHKTNPIITTKDPQQRPENLTFNGAGETQRI